MEKKERKKEIRRAQEEPFKHIVFNNINSQLYATITDFIDNYNQLNMFRATISPTLRSLCLGLCLLQ
jgi:hypothetical protein